MRKGLLLILCVCFFENKEITEFTVAYFEKIRIVKSVLDSNTTMKDDGSS